MLTVVNKPFNLRFIGGGIEHSLIVMCACGFQIKL